MSQQPPGTVTLTSHIIISADGEEAWMFPSSCPMSSLLTERPVLSEDDLTQTQSPAQTGRIFLSIVMTELSLSVLLSA